MDKIEAQYTLESTSQPLGVSSYELSKLIPEEFKGSMPTIEEIGNSQYALSSGFVLGWVEMTVKAESLIDEMNK